MSQFLRGLPNMDKFLRQLDLNLLKSLFVLLEEKNVTHAADRMHITQSAMSKTLRRLREAFNDPILIKTQNGLATTPIAEQLQAQLVQVFGQLATLNPEEFCPATTTERIRIAAPETFALGVMPEFVVHLKALAPGLQLELIHLMPDHMDKLATGEIDFAIYLDQVYPEEIITRRLFQSSPKVWCRKSHPLTSKSIWSLDDICQYPKIAFDFPNILPSELQHILDVLESAELQREVLLKTSHLPVALAMLVQTDALMVAPDYLMAYPVGEVVSRDVSHIPLFNCMSNLNVDLISHQRTASSPAHNWIIEKAKELLVPTENASEPHPLIKVVSSR